MFCKLSRFEVQFLGTAVLGFAGLLLRNCIKLLYWGNPVIYYISMVTYLFTVLNSNPV